MTGSKFPEEAEIGHVRVTISREKGLSASAGVVGAYGSDKQTVLIDDDLGPDQERETLLHELLHGVMKQCGLGALFEEWEKSMDTKEIEEKVVNLLSPRLLELLRDNAPVVKFLLVP